MTKSANELSRDTDGTPKKSRIGQTVCPHRAMVASHEHRWSVPSEEEDDDEEDEEEEGDTCRAEMHWTRRDHEAYVPISVPPASSVHALGTASIASIKNMDFLPSYTYSAFWPMRIDGSAHVVATYFL